MDYRQKYLKYRHKYVTLKIGGTDPTLDPTLNLLIQKQNTYLPQALEELRQNQKKIGHWAWWAFPNNKPGTNEPSPGTFVDKQTAPLLLSQGPPIWKQTLEYLCNLLDIYGPSIIPNIDHGRIHYFIIFWDQINPKPDWFRRVLTTLKLYFPNESLSSLGSSSLGSSSRGSSSLGLSNQGSSNRGSSSRDSSIQGLSSENIFSPDSSSHYVSSDDKLNIEIKEFQKITRADPDTARRFILGANNLGLNLEDAISYYFETN